MVLPVLAFEIFEIASEHGRVTSNHDIKLALQACAAQENKTKYPALTLAAAILLSAGVAQAKYGDMVNIGILGKCNPNSLFHDEIERDGYGQGVHMDPFGGRER